MPDGRGFSMGRGQGRASAASRASGRDRWDNPCAGTGNGNRAARTTTGMRERGHLVERKACVTHVPCTCCMPRLARACAVHAMSHLTLVDARKTLAGLQDSSEGQGDDRTLCPSHAANEPSAAESNNYTGRRPGRHGRDAEVDEEGRGDPRGPPPTFFSHLFA